MSLHFELRHERNVGVSALAKL